MIDLLVIIKSNPKIMFSSSQGNPFTWRVAWYLVFLNFGCWYVDGLSSNSFGCSCLQTPPRYWNISRSLYSPTVLSRNVILSLNAWIKSSFHHSSSCRFLHLITLSSSYHPFLHLIIFSLIWVNRKGFIIAFSSSLVRFTRGCSQVTRVMKAMYVAYFYGHVLKLPYNRHWKKTRYALLFTAKCGSREILQNLFSKSREHERENSRNK